MSKRRDFLKTSVILGAFALLHKWAAAAAEADRHGSMLPLRRLIRNGEKVTTFCLGGWHLGNTNDPLIAERMVERSMEMGVRFFDSARVYNEGGSEKFLGQFLVPKYRDEIFLMTKSHAKNAEDATKHLEQSLSALKTDRLDLWQIHTITTPEDVDNRIKNGVLDVFLNAKEKGKTRYIGFTGHTSPDTNLHFLKRLDELGVEMDTSQMPLNIMDPSFESFQNKVLPVLLEREYGVIAMKTMAGGSIMGRRIDTTPEWIKTEMIPDVVRETGLSLADLHRYVYALPVSSLVSGCNDLEQMEHNISVLQNLKNISMTEMEQLVELVKPFAGGIVENYKRVLD